MKDPMTPSQEKALADSFLAITAAQTDEERAYQTNKAVLRAMAGDFGPGPKRNAEERAVELMRKGVEREVKSYESRAEAAAAAGQVPSEPG